MYLFILQYFSYIIDIFNVYRSVTFVVSSTVNLEMDRQEDFHGHLVSGCNTVTT